MADTVYENDDGIKAILDASTGKATTPIGGGTLRLFTAPTTVNKTKVIGDFTQATFPGYAGIALTAATWAAATVAANLASSAYGATLTFTRTTTGVGQLIYGWYLTDAGNTKVYACALFAGGPYNIQNSGDAVSCSPTLSHQSLN